MAGADDEISKVPEVTPGEPTKMMTPEVIADENIIETAYIEEDFDHRQFINEALNSNVTIDVNRGEVFLPTIVLPNSVGKEDPNQQVTRLGEYDNAEQSHSIIIDDNTSLRGRDAIELEAYDTIRITGSLSAGNGGISLSANKGIYIDGNIESSGPIRLRLTQPDGKIMITGMVNTTSSSNRASGSIHMLSRGEVTVSGVVKTGNAQYADSGQIEIVSYGSVTVTRNTAILKTGDSEGGNSGAISISSESALSVKDGSSIESGEALSLGERNSTLNAGNVTLRVDELDLEDNTKLIAGRCGNCSGGNIDVIAAVRMVAGQNVEVRAGDGLTGGETSLNVGSATIGKNSSVYGGAGREHAGRVFIDTAGRLKLRYQAQLIGGQGKCTDGGPVVGLVGNELVVTVGSKIKGGDSTLDGEDCIAPTKGGDVQLFCRKITGPIEHVTEGGNGSRQGESQLTSNSNYSREDPIPHPNTVGHLESKVFDRGDLGLTMSPVLVSSEFGLPEGTRIDLLLCGALNPDGPFGEWYVPDAQGNYSDELQRFRYLKYRVQLHGRSLDTPVADRFEIDLVPAD